eukprot:jgi/Chrzof1/4048/Cz13g18130.t1
MALRTYSQASCGVSIGAARLPDPEKAWFGGQDATLELCRGQMVVAGVFDGVGGASGNNPEQVAVYARKLSLEVGAWLEQHLPTCGPEKIKAALEYAHLTCQEEMCAGSCTACIMALNQDRRLAYIASMGDSGAIHIRAGETPEVVTSEGQHKGWNHPLQLGVDYTGRPYGASIHRTEMRFVDVQPGDVIVLATDGVLDNLFPQAIHDLVVEGLDCADCADDIAAAVVARARAACEADSPHVTPWSLALKAHLATKPRCSLQEWEQHHYLHKKFPQGGKMDDITCVVVIIPQGREVPEEEVVCAGCSHCAMDPIYERFDSEDEDYEQTNQSCVVDSSNRTAPTFGTFSAYEMLDDMSSLEQQLDEVQSRCKAAEAASAEMSAQAAEGAQHNSQLQAQRAAAEALNLELTARSAAAEQAAAKSSLQLLQVEASNTKLVSTASEAEQEIALLRVKLVQAETHSAQMAARADAAEAANCQLDSKCATAEAEAAQLISKLATAEGSIAQLELRYVKSAEEQAALSAKCTAAEARNMELTAACTKFELEQTAAQVLHDSMGQQIKQLEESLCSSQSALAAVTAEHALATQRIQQAAVDAQQLTDAFNTLKLSHEALQQQVTEVSLRNKQLEQEVAALTTLNQELQLELQQDKSACAAALQKTQQLQRALHNAEQQMAAIASSKMALVDTAVQTNSMNTASVCMQTTTTVSVDASVQSDAQGSVSVGVQTSSTGPQGSALATTTATAMPTFQSSTTTTAGGLKRAAATATPRKANSGAAKVRDSTELVQKAWKLVTQRKLVPSQQLQATNSFRVTASPPGGLRVSGGRTSLQLNMPTTNANMHIRRGTAADAYMQFSIAAVDAYVPQTAAASQPGAIASPSKPAKLELLKNAWSLATAKGVVSDQQGSKPSSDGCFKMSNLLPGLRVHRPSRDC